jgi:hypothetical protein
LIFVGVHRRPSAAKKCKAEGRRMKAEGFVSCIRDYLRLSNQREGWLVPLARFGAYVFDVAIYDLRFTALARHDSEAEAIFDFCPAAHVP